MPDRATGAAPSPYRFLVLSLTALLLISAACEALFGSWIGWRQGGRGDYSTWIGNGLPLLQVMILAACTDALFRVFAERFRTRPGQPGGVPRLALQLLSTLIYTSFLVFSIRLVFDESVGTVLAASGIVGLAVGFALRGLLSDIFSGIALHLDASFEVGNWIDVTVRGLQISGRVVDIQWRTVVIADRMENHVAVPNGEFAQAIIVNRSRPSIATEYGAPIAIQSRYDRARVIQVLDNALSRAVRDGVLLPSPPPKANVTGVDGGMILYRLVYCLNPSAVSPSRALSTTLGHAVDFLKAAGIRLNSAREAEVLRPRQPGSERYTELDTRLRVLADVPMLAVLSQDELRGLADRSSLHMLSDGSPVIRKGESGDSMFVVAEGRLSVLADSEDGPREVAVLWPGECAGEMSLLTGEPRSATVVTCGTTCLLEVPKRALLPILQANPMVAERIAAAIGQRKANGVTAVSTDAATQERQDTVIVLIRRIRGFFGLG